MHKRLQFMSPVRPAGRSNLRPSGL